MPTDRSAQPSSRPFASPRLSAAGRARSALALCLAAGLASLTPAAPARADSFVETVNSFYKNVEQKKRSDLVIIPVLAKMDAVPTKLNDPLTAALITPSSKQWKTALDWISAQPQLDALAALRKVTDDDNWKTAWVFAQPYGANAIDPEIAMTGLYTELGENPTLAMAEFKHLDAVRKLELLAHYEATRLLAEGKGDEALSLMVHWAYFARQIADRQFFTEKVAGTQMLVLALQRMRDLAWQDFRSEKRTMTPEGIRNTLYSKIDAVRSVLNVSRYELPTGDYQAASQIVQRTFTPNARAKPQEFSRSFARIAAGNRPYRLFPENAKWGAVVQMHADTNETTKRVKGVFGDWSRRFDVGPFDLLLKIPTDWSRIDKVQFASLDLILGNLGEILSLRNQLRMEAAGTRAALATYGYFLARGDFPRDVNASVPQMIRTMDRDPFSRKSDKLGFFVPIRDFQAALDNLEVADTLRDKRVIDPNAPHTIRVFPSMMGNTYPNFEIPLRADTFVLYSAGPDGNINGMFLATQMIEDNKGDYLLWPPVISLLRKNLQDTGKAP